MSIFNREEIIDQNFLDHVRLGHMPSARTNIHLSQTNIRSSELVSLFESQIMSRHMDLKARILKNEGNENVSTSTILWSLIFLFPFCLYQQPWTNLNPSLESTIALIYLGVFHKYPQKKIEEIVFLTTVKHIEL